MARRRTNSRRSGSGVTDLLSGMVDDVKDFVDEDLLDRARDAERDARRVGRDWTDSDERVSRPRGSQRDRSSGGRDEEMDELRSAIRSLADKINRLSASGPGAGDTTDKA